MQELDVLAVGAHPDDVEIGCGGILALLAARGLRVGLLHLTRGELGTRGTVEVRATEAAAAAQTLGAQHEILDLGDGGLRTGRLEEDLLIQSLRETRPRWVLAPAPTDRHPDHERAHRLVRDCCFYSGLVKRPDPASLPPHRPRVVLNYMLHGQEAPTLVVDIGLAFETKVRALACYESQLSLPLLDTSSDETIQEVGESQETWVSSRTFGSAVMARARHFGAQIGVEFGEPLLALEPLPALELAELLTTAR